MKLDDLLLLKLIDSGGNTSMLLNRGFTYSQIANKVQEHIDEGNLIIEEFDILLTEQGKQALDEGFREKNYKGKDKWILPQTHYYQKPISFNKIVLPKKI